MDTGFKISVSGEHAGGNQIVLEECFFDGGRQGARVADAGGTTVAHEVKAQLIEVRLQTGGVEVIGNDAGTRRKRGFDGGIDGEAALDRLFGEKTCGQHDRGVGGVGAGGDGGDHHRSVSESGGFWILDFGFGIFG